MKRTKALLYGMMCMIALFSLTMVSCSDDDDNRTFEEVKIVGVKINDELFTPEYGNNETKIVVPAGRDLSKAKLQILVANGELENFVNEVEYDCRKPIDLNLIGSDGNNVATKLRIQSPPKLSLLVIEGIASADLGIYEGASSLIVQVPKTTDLTMLKVYLEFINGILMDFENGIEKDYTNPVQFSLKGADEETVYPYEFIITTETVGPASVKAMKFNGIETDSVNVEGTTLIPYIPALMDFSSVNIELEAGYGNKIDPAFSGSGLNLLAGNNKVKVTGTNGIETEFTIGVPQLSFAPLFAKKASELTGFGANDLASVGFSDPYVLIANPSGGNTMPLYFDMDGNEVGKMVTTGISTASHGIRRFTTDEDGAVLVNSLGISAGNQWVYKFDNVTGTGSEYISFSKASLGTSYNPRAAGLKISGSLSGDAVIVMPMAQNTDVFVWKVTGGTLNPTPQRYSFPYTGTSYYWNVAPMPVGTPGFVGFATANNSDFPQGIVYMTDNMTENFKLTGIKTTGGKLYKHNGRTYLAYTTQDGTDKALMRICDVTTGDIDSYKNPIFNRAMPVAGSNGNGTMDAEIALIGGKLHVVFGCTNVGFTVYCFE